jgi:hypothetical protein
MRLLATKGLVLQQGQSHREGVLHLFQSLVHFIELFMSTGVRLVALGELRIVLQRAVMCDEGSFMGDEQVAM